MSAPRGAASFARQLAPHLVSAQAYRPGRSARDLETPIDPGRVVKLASNENPYGPSPRALAVLGAVGPTLHRYPDNRGVALREALADFHRIEPQRIALGCGSEGILASIFRTILRDDDHVLSSEGTFVGLGVLAATRGVTLRRVPLRSYGFDLDRLADAVDGQTRLLYIANPNNPTGAFVEEGNLRTFLDRLPEHLLVVLDEAYAEYVTPPSALLPLSLRDPRLLRLRTFSKAFGLAGLRVGYGVGEPEVVELLLRAKLPFLPNAVAQEAAREALGDREFVARTVATNRASLDRFAEVFTRLAVPFVPSQANFAMLPCRGEEAAARLCRRLEGRGIIIRHLTQFGLPHCVRVSTGRPGENEAFLEAFEEILSEEPGLFNRT